MPVQVFLAGVMQGSHAEVRLHEQGWRASFTELVERHLPGARVYDHYAAHPEAVGYRMPRIREVWEEGNRRAAESDLVLCWLPVASMGTAIEMYLAWKAGAVVVAVTPLAWNWVVQVTADLVVPDLDALERAFREGRVGELLARKGRLQPEPGAKASSTSRGR